MRVALLSELRARPAALPKRVLPSSTPMAPALHLEPVPCCCFLSGPEMAAEGDVAGDRQRRYDPYDLLGIDRLDVPPPAVSAAPSNSAGFLVSA